ncbi:MAG: hypothetical protein VX700_00195 [Pseudomonadota bacterium]|nr:hypothetical protein [Pseudomonadota bacterium]
MKFSIISSSPIDSVSFIRIIYAQYPRDTNIAAGEKNYITREGVAALQVKPPLLRRQKRPTLVKIVSWAIGNADHSENGDYIYGSKCMRNIDGRIRHLTKRLERLRCHPGHRQR